MNSASHSACPVCEGKLFRQLHQIAGPAPLHIHQCLTCSLQLQHPQPSWEQIQSIYDAAYYKAWGMAEGESRAVADMKKSTFHRRLREITRFVSPPAPVLDVGTAAGFFLETAQQAGFSPFGIELSQYSADLAKQKFGNERIWNGTLETAPPAAFPPATFAAVAMCDLLEHVTDPVETLRAARRFLQPGGIILVMTPNTDSLTCRCMGRRWTHYKAEHLFYFNRRSIKEAARRAGLSVADFRPAIKTLTLRYAHHQMMVYRHWLLTPAVRAANSLLFFARDWPMPVIIGEFVAILRNEPVQ